MTQISPRCDKSGVRLVGNFHNLLTLKGLRWTFSCTGTLNRSDVDQVVIWCVSEGKSL